MPQVRVDPLTGLKTIIAGERADRPGGGFEVPPDAPIDPERDPFLPGHEDQTPPEVYRVPDGNGSLARARRSRTCIRRWIRRRARPRATPTRTCSRPSRRPARTR